MCESGHFRNPFWKCPLFLSEKTEGADEHEILSLLWNGAYRQEYMRKGILFVAAAIGEDKEDIERIYGDLFMDISNLNELPAKLTGIVKRHIRV